MYLYIYIYYVHVCMFVGIVSSPDAPPPHKSSAPTRALVPAAAASSSGSVSAASSTSRGVFDANEWKYRLRVEGNTHAGKLLIHTLVCCLLLLLLHLHLSLCPLSHYIARCI